MQIFSLSISNQAVGHRLINLCGPRREVGTIQLELHNIQGDTDHPFPSFISTSEEHWKMVKNFIIIVYFINFDFPEQTGSMVHRTQL